MSVKKKKLFKNKSLSFVELLIISILIISITTILIHSSYNKNIKTTKHIIRPKTDEQLLMIENLEYEIYLLKIDISNNQKRVEEIIKKIKKNGRYF